MQLLPQLEIVKTGCFCPETSFFVSRFTVGF